MPCLITHICMYAHICNLDHMLLAPPQLQDTIVLREVRSDASDPTVVPLTFQVCVKSSAGVYAIWYSLLVYIS
jgi:hypothetical protein